MPNNSNYKELLLTAVKASIEAGVAIMKIYEQDFKVAFKDDNSPLTKADLSANKVINKYLKETELPIISEENKQISFKERKEWERCWMVDPLDGTKEFVKRNGEFTVNIALIEFNKPVMGVIYVPVSNTIYFSIVSEKKAYKLIMKDVQLMNFNLNEAVEIFPEVNRSNEIKVVGSRSHRSKQTDEYICNLEKEGKRVSMVSVGSSLKFCLTAEGKANVYPRFAPTMEWDTAAGHALCNAVGLKVMKSNAAEELIYNKENLLNPYFIVS